MSLPILDIFKCNKTFDLNKQVWKGDKITPYTQPIPSFKMKKYRAWEGGKHIIFSFLAKDNNISIMSLF